MTMNEYVNIYLNKHMKILNVSININTTWMFIECIFISWCIIQNEDMISLNEDMISLVISSMALLCFIWYFKSCSSTTISTIQCVSCVSILCMMTLNIGCPQPDPNTTISFTYDDITSEIFEVTETYIGWIKIVSCEEGPNYPLFTNPYYSVLINTAYSFRIIPPGKNKSNPNYDSFAVIAKPNSTSMNYINNGQRPAIHNEINELNEWIGSEQAVNRLTTETPSHSPFGYQFFYWAQNNYGGFHITNYDFIRGECWWQFQDYMGEDIEVYVGYEIDINSNCTHQLTLTLNPTLASITWNPTKSPTFNPTIHPTESSTNPTIHPTQSTIHPTQSTIHPTSSPTICYDINNQYANVRYQS
eukprot:330608_1